MLDLGTLNVIIGPNNAGKSSVLRAVYAIQDGVGELGPDVRPGAEPLIEMTVETLPGSWQAGGAHVDGGTLTIRGGELGALRIDTDLQRDYGVARVPAREPDHAVVPILAKRKAVAYSENFGLEETVRVASNLANLAAKLSRLSNPSFPGSDEYRDTCEASLGFVVTATPAPNGQRPGVYLPDKSTLAIDQMGEGVPNLVGMLADLALSESKIFLIEEPETDLHPAALKALLGLIEKSAAERGNQFLVSTHSNIVLSFLGAAPDSRVFYVDAERGVFPPVAHIEPVEQTPTARMRVLRELGYSLSDFELWDGWLILEESSAERIIRDYLIPWFAPKLARVRTLSANGNTEVEPTFADFHRLVRFTHLEEAYRNQAWVRIDDDEQGKRIVARLREQYPSWTADRFGTFPAEKFEVFYPAVFQEQAAALDGITDRKRQREAKRVLLDAVRNWTDENTEEAKAAFAESAKPVLEDLVSIEAELGVQPTPPVE